MVAPAVAIVANPLILGAATVAGGAVALGIIKKDEITDAATAVAAEATHFGSKALPLLASAVGLGSLSRWRTPVAEFSRTEEGQIQRGVRTTSTGIQLMDVARAPLAEPPPESEPPKVDWKNILTRAGDIARKVTYWNGVLSLSEIARRYAMNDPNTDPLLYAVLYKPVFGESTTARTVFGVYQNISVGWAAGTTLFPGIMLFSRAVPYIALGQTIPLLHQVRATDTDWEHIDFNSSSALEAAYGVVSFGAIRWARLVLNKFGHVPFTEFVGRFKDATMPASKEWVTSLNCERWFAVQIWELLAESFPNLARVIRPDFVPSFKAMLAFAGGWLVWGGATQAAISPVVEKSDAEQSVYQSTVRRLLSMVLECPLMLGYNTSTRFFFVVLDNGLFAGTQWATDGYFSAFDGQALAVDQARRLLMRPQNQIALATRLQEAPFTNKNVIGDADVSLAPKTWAELALRLPQEEVPPRVYTHLLEVGSRLIGSPDRGARRVGLASAVLLSQLSLDRPRTVSVRQEGLRTHLAAQLQQLPVVSYKGRPLKREELLEVFQGIEDGYYDNQYFAFPQFFGLTP